MGNFCWALQKQRLGSGVTGGSQSSNNINNGNSASRQRGVGERRGEGVQGHNTEESGPAGPAAVWNAGKGSSSGSGSSSREDRSVGMVGGEALHGSCKVGAEAGEGVGHVGIQREGQVTTFGDVDDWFLCLALEREAPGLMK